MLPGTFCSVLLIGKKKERKRAVSNAIIIITLIDKDL